MKRDHHREHVRARMKRSARFRCDSNLVAPNASYVPAQFIQQHS
jgi:hypothetical protein